jgi:hypothetical protein
MRKTIFAILLAAALLLACTLTPKSTQVPTVLNIRAYMDGRSQLIIRGDALHWHHLDFDVPGRWEFAKASQPTWLNQVEWYPTWPDVPDSTNDFCDCDSSSYRGVPMLAGTNQRVWLDVVQGRGKVSVVQQPDADNDFTLIVELDDDEFDGAEWYEVNLNYVIGRSKAGRRSTSTPASVETPTVAPLASLSGRILLGAGDPFLRVYAREVNTGQVYWVQPGEGNSTYTIPDLPPGTYVVVGWFHPMGVSGAYTSLDTILAETEEQMHACEEAIVEIELQAGEAYASADIGCWGGDFFGLTE